MRDYGGECEFVKWHNDQDRTNQGAWGQFWIQGSLSPTNSPTSRVAP